jgi:hypothetical protein
VEGASVCDQIEPIARHHPPTKKPNQTKKNGIVESKAINVKELHYGAHLYFSEYYPPCSRY